MSSKQDHPSRALVVATLLSFLALIVFFVLLMLDPSVAQRAELQAERQCLRKDLVLRPKYGWYGPQTWQMKCVEWKYTKEPSVTKIYRRPGHL